MSEEERVTYDCHRCRSYDLPYWCCPYCYRTLTRSDREVRALLEHPERERRAGAAREGR